MKSIFFIVSFLTFVSFSLATRKLNSLYIPPPMSLTYHNGPLLDGDLHVSLFWYGKFSPSQKSIIIDFILSINSPISKTNPSSVSKWWQTIETYVKKVGKKPTRVFLTYQGEDKNASLGKSLKRAHISELAQHANSDPPGITIVLTAADIYVEGFCLSCQYRQGQTQSVWVNAWVGDSSRQCPGQCAWPFHQPIYGPQTPPLAAPNGDVGVDGMVVNIAHVLAEAVTNPFGNGYFMGPPNGPIGVASACTGLFGKGVSSGYTGELMKDAATGASYNALGVNNRKYLLPALFDLDTSQCLTLV